MFKKSYLFLLFASTLVFMGGCAQKPEANIRLEPFTPNPAVIQKSGTVVIKKIVDKRENKRVVGKIEKDGKPVTIIYSDQDMQEWFEDALKRSLEVEGCRVVTEINEDNRVANIKVEIDSIKAVFDKSTLTGENLSAEARATLYIKQGKSKITKKVSFSQSRWAPPFSGESEIKEFLQETLAGLVEELRENIDCYRF
ncbi:MAG: YajG family lipoprotein [Hydrogenimonas sp.]|nr:YajG family lipoprotein [Hydrogenimonas sp.]